MSFVSFGTYIFGDQILQLPAHIFKLIMNGSCLSSLGFIPIRVGLTMHCLSFKNRHFVAKDLLKLKNTVNRLNIILYIVIKYL